MSNSPGHMSIAERRASDMKPAILRLNADSSRPPWFTNVLVGFAVELRRSFHELHTGVSDHILGRAALACRNLLEIRYWTMYAAKSEDNIWRLRKEALIDMRDMLDKFTTACQANPELAPVLPSLQQGRAWFEEQCRQTGESADGPYIRVSNLAQELGLADEHRTMSSFLSKLIHPTGFSICLPGAEDFTYQQLYSVGCWYFNDCFERVNEVLKRVNLPVLE